jgi:hypothetical protein
MNATTVPEKSPLKFLCWSSFSLPNSGYSAPLQGLYSAAFQ